VRRGDLLRQTRRGSEEKIYKETPFSFKRTIYGPPGTRGKRMRAAALELGGKKGEKKGKIIQSRCPKRFVKKT